MKTAVFVFSLFCVSAAFAQSVGASYNTIVMAEHPQHASQHDLATPQDIFVRSDYAYAKGELPLWEFGPVSKPVPLGDIARQNRKEHETAKKSEIVWEN